LPDLHLHQELLVTLIHHHIHSTRIPGLSLQVIISYAIDNRLQVQQEEFPPILFDEFLIVVTINFLEIASPIHSFDQTLSDLNNPPFQADVYPISYRLQIPDKNSPMYIGKSLGHCGGIHSCPVIRLIFLKHIPGLNGGKLHVNLKFLRDVPGTVVLMLFFRTYFQFQILLSIHSTLLPRNVCPPFCPISRIP
jgi:hypothetical protein